MEFGVRIKNVSDRGLEEPCLLTRCEYGRGTADRWDVRCAADAQRGAVYRDRPGAVRVNRWPVPREDSRIPLRRESQFGEDEERRRVLRAM